MFADFFYPANKDRDGRLRELVADCNFYQKKVSEHKELLEKKIKDASDLLAGFKDMPSCGEKVTIKFPSDDNWKISGSSLLITTLITTGVHYGLNACYKSWLLKQGLIGEAGLIRILGYPRWFKLARTGGCIVVMFAIESIIDAISGAIQRDQYRIRIGECIEPRKNIYKAFCQNELLIRNIDRLIDVINSVKDILPEQEIKHLIDNWVNRTKHEIEMLTDSQINEDLETEDRRRGSWTKEDHMMVKLELPPILMPVDGGMVICKRSSLSTKDNAMMSLKTSEPLELAESPVDYLNGALVAVKGDTKIYLIKEGRRCLIPNSNVFEALYPNRDLIHYIDKTFLESMPLGESLSESACLMAVNNSDNTIYFYSNGKKSRIGEMGFNKAGFNRNAVFKVLPTELNNIESTNDFLVADW